MWFQWKADIAIITVFYNLQVYSSQQIWLNPCAHGFRSLGPGVRHWLTVLFIDFTLLTLDDEDTNSILTDNANTQQANSKQCDNACDPTWCQFGTNTSPGVSKPLAHLKIAMGVNLTFKSTKLIITMKVCQFLEHFVSRAGSPSSSALVRIASNSPPLLLPLFSTICQWQQY